jgi:hypothetical protein
VFTEAKRWILQAAVNRVKRWRGIAIQTGKLLHPPPTLPPGVGVGSDQGTPAPAPPPAPSRHPNSTTRHSDRGVGISPPPIAIPQRTLTGEGKDMVQETPPPVILFGLGLVSALPQINSSQLKPIHVQIMHPFVCRARGLRARGGAEWRCVDFELRSDAFPANLRTTRSHPLAHSPSCQT